MRRPGVGTGEEGEVAGKQWGQREEEALQWGQGRDSGDVEVLKTRGACARKRVGRLLFL
jgi:hypothetical protein